MPQTVDDLRAHRFVVFDRGANTTFGFSNWLWERIEPDQVASKLRDVEGLLAAIRSGLGVGPHSITAAADDPNLVRGMIAPPETDVFSWLVFSPEAWKRPEVKAFSAFFVPRFRAHFGKTSADDRGV